MRFGNSALNALPFLSLVTANPGWHRSPTATVDFGTVIGVTTSVPESPVKVHKFLGVPYAAPPVRFSPAQPPVPQSTPYDASYYRPACVQQFNYPEASRERVMEWFNTPPPPGGESEDCLNLNIFVPATKGKKAVMFWMHGGCLQFGSGSIEAYDGSHLAATQNVIVVTINYRTNVFGFPGSPELPFTEQNLGFLDQHFALSWVSKNIASFSGDPSRILIFGESAGSGSVDAMLTSYQPPAKPPFHAAIMESGQYSLRADVPDYTASWTSLAAAVNCATASDTLACMRALPATTLKDALEHLALTFSFVPDNVTYVGNAAEPNRLRGEIANVPTLAGSNADEGIIFTLAYNNTRAYLMNLFANNTALVDRVIAAYPLGEDGIETETQQIAAIYTDYGFQCTCAVVANDTKTGGIPSYRYFYNASFPNVELFPGAGVYHSAEIVSVFGTYPREGATAEQIALSNVMQKTWAGFAKEPYAGPGWGEVPAVGVFGDEGLQVKTYWDVDEGFCELYKPVYAIL